MIQQSLQYLRNDEDSWLTTVLIGGVLSLLGALVIPAILVLGYLVRVVRETMRGNEHPPAFDEWGDLLGDGLRAFAVVVVYGLVPAVVSAVVIGGGVLSFVVVGGSTAGMSGPGAVGPQSGLGLGIGLLVILVGGVLALVLTLLAAYIVPAAIATIAEHDDLSRAFSVGELRPVLTSGTYATAWLSGFAIVLAAGLVAGALNAIPPVGFLAGGFLGFYAAVAAYYLIGTAWGEIHPVEVRDGGDAADERPAV
ncbi:DUF4013 domain-containing protein [Halobellus rubicundus]|uniref:DUF4013 domain-containing protein n=1 Tax=Halobellus rubicundus TaxID=2996466 RepID=A0ABD5ME76_9EURY